MKDSLAKLVFFEGRIMDIGISGCLVRARVPSVARMWKIDVFLFVYVAFGRIGTVALFDMRWGRYKVFEKLAVILRWSDDRVWMRRVGSLLGRMFLYCDKD